MDYWNESVQAYFIIAIIVMVVINLGVTAGLSFIPAFMAKKKGYTFGGFFCLSFFVSFVLTIIIAALITDKNPKPKPLYMPYGPAYAPYGYPPYGQPYMPQQVPPPPYGAPPPPQDLTGPPADNTAYYPPRCPNCGENQTSQSDYCPRCGVRVK